MIMWLFLLVTCHMMTTSFGNDNNAADIEVMSESAENSFNLTVIVLTMNRPKSLQRLLESIKSTDFEFDDDKFDVEIHIDKTVGGLYEQTIRLVEIETCVHLYPPPTKNVCECCIACFFTA